MCPNIAGRGRFARFSPRRLRFTRIITATGHDPSVFDDKHVYARGGVKERNQTGTKPRLCALKTFARFVANTARDFGRQGRVVVSSAYIQENVHS